MSNHDDDGAPPAVALPEAGTGERARNRALRRKRRRLQEAWFIGAVAVLTLAIPVLGYVGFHKVFTTTQGRKVDAQNDPTKPNYEADVVPTPVMLLAQTGSNGLSSLTMLSIGGGDAGGAVVLIPIDTVTNVLADQTTTTRPGATAKTTTLAAALPHSNTAELTQLTANVMGLSFDETVLLNDDALAQFVTPVAPLTINNPDRLVQVDSRGRSAVLFPAGSLTLQAADVPKYMAATNPNESALARVARQQVVWQAWIAAVKSSTDPNVVPGETTSGLGRYLRGLAKGNVQFASLPGTPGYDANGAETFVPDATRVGQLIDSLVALPTPANPGDRIRVRVLSGVGPVDATALVAAHLVAADAQITIVGNADRFDYATTKVVYYDDNHAAAASAAQQLLGVGEVSKSATSVDTEDLTITIGQDLVAKRGLKITTSSGG
ncbi:MAG TPA: LytR C-terminal domain-containing protein [Acidimicrobiales bacterium]|jgi:anionic cell wall polymer biosynthesis LytR-Cps2A-Psr (LCP) family protein|nr:LytR C-terminal domain-containing protein [Acidimicrobiales bacterium]